jgi:hypothetical protein
LKIALDALCRALHLDDRAVVDLHLTKRIDPLHPHLDVEVEAIAEWEFDRTDVYLGEDSSDDSDLSLDKSWTFRWGDRPGIQ